MVNCYLKKPRYSEHLEIGVSYFSARLSWMVELWSQEGMKINCRVNAL